MMKIRYNQKNYLKQLITRIHTHIYAYKYYYSTLQAIYRLSTLQPKWSDAAAEYAFEHRYNKIYKYIYVYCIFMYTLLSLYMFFFYKMKITLEMRNEIQLKCVTISLPNVLFSLSRRDLHCVSWKPSQITATIK